MVRSQLDGCGKFLKYSMFFVNFLIFIGGIVVCGLGIYALVGGQNVEKVMGASLFTASAGLLVAFGGIVAFISFLGCCGAIKEVKCLLATFFVIMFLMSILIALGAIFAFVVKDKVSVEDEFVNALKETMKEYGKGDASKPLNEAWDGVQSEFKCCGARGYKDWKEVNNVFANVPPFPDSCCKDTGTNPKCTSVQSPPADSFYDQGCYGSIKDYVEKHTKPLAIIGIIVAVVIVLSMVFSCALCLMI